MKRVRPANLVGHDYMAAARTDVPRPDGVTFVRTVAPGSLTPLIMREIVLPGLWVLLSLGWIARWLDTATTVEAVFEVLFEVLYVLMWVTVAALGTRKVVRRRRAAAQGRWPNGLTLWPDRLISFVSDNEAIVAPRAALDGVTVADDGTIRVQSTSAYGATTSTELGVFSGEPSALQRLVDTWYAEAGATT